VRQLNWHTILVIAHIGHVSMLGQSSYRSHQTRIYAIRRQVPEAALYVLTQACLIAADYRMRYETDVVVDVVGYRR